MLIDYRLDNNLLRNGRSGGVPCPGTPPRNQCSYISHTRLHESHRDSVLGFNYKPALNYVAKRVLEMLSIQHAAKNQSKHAFNHAGTILPKLEIARCSNA